MQARLPLPLVSETGRVRHENTYMTNQAPAQHWTGRVLIAATTHRIMIMNAYHAQESSQVVGRQVRVVLSWDGASLTAERRYLQTDMMLQILGGGEVDMHRPELKQGLERRHLQQLLELRKARQPRSLISRGDLTLPNKEHLLQCQALRLRKVLLLQVVRHLTYLHQLEEAQGRHPRTAKSRIPLKNLGLLSNMSYFQNPRYLLLHSLRLLRSRVYVNQLHFLRQDLRSQGYQTQNLLLKQLLCLHPWLSLTYRLPSQKLVQLPPIK